MLVPAIVPGSAVCVYPTVPDALAALRSGQVDAVVYGQTILDYYAERIPQKDIEILAQTFDRQALAFPLPDASPLREPINGVLRSYLLQPGWRDIQDQYLAVERVTARVP